MALNNQKDTKEHREPEKPEPTEEDETEMDLAAKRKEHGLTQAELAQRVGIAQRTVAAYECLFLLSQL